MPNPDSIPNLKKIQRGGCKGLDHLTWNDPNITQKYEILTIDQLLFKDIAVFKFKQSKN